MSQIIPDETVQQIVRDASTAKRAVDRAIGIVDRLRDQLVDTRRILTALLPGLSEHSYPYKGETSYRKQALDAIAAIDKLLGDRP